MNINEYFEQFKGDVKYINPWKDERVSAWLTSAGLDGIDFQTHPSYTILGAIHVDIAGKKTHKEMIALLKTANNGCDFKYEKIKLRWQPKLSFLAFDVRIIADVILLI